MFLAVGENGTILRSTDGKSWLPAKILNIGANANFTARVGYDVAEVAMAAGRMDLAGVINIPE